MKKNLIFSFFFLIQVNTYIILPFNQLNQELENIINSNDITSITTSNSILNLYTSIYLGDTPYKLLLKLSPYNNYFSFISVPNINFIYTNYTFYNPFLSKSLHRNKNINYKEEFREVTDVFYFITNEEDINNIYQKEKNIKEKFKPYLYLNCFLSNWYFSDNYTGILGLGRNSSNYPQYNFMKELKAKSVINNSIWSVDFNNSNNEFIDYEKGNLIIGEFPHVYNPSRYKSENYYKIKLYEDYFNINNNNDWFIKIENSYIYKEGEVRTSSNYINYINIIFGLYTMQAPYFLFEQLKSLFFEKYFSKKICQYQKVLKDNEEKIIIFCSKKNFGKNEQKLFPKIIFYIKNYSEIIQLELNDTDVFVTKNDKVYFMINFDLNGRQDLIKVGQIFLYKYKMVFDYDNEEVGIYISNKINKSRKGYKEIIWIFFIILFGCFFFLGFKKGLWCIEKLKSRKIK